MRVIAGTFHGLNLLPVKGCNTRPTGAKVKEAMFNILAPYLSSVTTGCDLFAGTGSLGIEAVSRGVEQMYLVDSNRQAQQTIKANIAKTHAEPQFQVLKMTADKALLTLQQQQIQLDLLLLDPPYAQHVTVELVQQAIQLGLMSTRALIVIETDYALKQPDLQQFTVIADKQYNQTYVQVWQLN